MKDEPLNVQVHIERLVLDGMDLPHAQRLLLQAALEAELGRLLAEGGLRMDLLSGDQRPALEAGEVRLASENPPERLGEQIARAVYTGLGNQ
jgi:hypothetical protein